MAAWKPVLGPTALALLLAACSSAPTATPTSTKDQAAPSLGKTDDLVPPDFQACATKTAQAEAKPVYLVFMFDKSGSMVVKSSPKWASATAASKAFFESGASGVHASLGFFPNQETYSCSASDYKKPKVAMSPLPSADFSASLDEQAPAGGTPTSVALFGAIQYAQDVAAGEGQGGTVAVVLVTDGLPDSNCTGNSVESVRDLAGSVASTIPTYVIGVGNQLGRLNEIAKGGGTKSAFIVKTEAPEQIQEDFRAAIESVKRSALACDYEIPAPPNGEKLDRDYVNVIYQGTQPETFGFDPSCATGRGWRYDDPDDPKRVVLCEESCASIKTRPGEVNVLFGCATKNGVVK